MVPLFSLPLFFFPSFFPWCLDIHPLSSSKCNGFGRDLDIFHPRIISVLHLVWKKAGDHCAKHNHSITRHVISYCWWIHSITSHLISYFWWIHSITSHLISLTALSFHHQPLFIHSKNIRIMITTWIPTLSFSFIPFHCYLMMEADLEEMDIDDQGNMQGALEENRTRIQTFRNDRRNTRTVTRNCRLKTALNEPYENLLVSTLQWLHS